MTMNPDDQSLIRRAQSGDRAAFEILYARYQPAIFNYLYYRIDDPDCAEELTSEVFVRMVKNIRSYQDQGRSFLAWLYTIAHHLRVDYYRENSPMKTLPLEETLHADPELHPDEACEQLLKAECLKKVMPYLTEEQQIVITAKFVEGRSNEEVANLLGKPEGAIKSLQHRALAALRRAIEIEGCYEYGV